MGRVAARSKLSVAEYLAWEREQSEKHEYYDGDVFAMAGGSPRHNALCVRISAALMAALGTRGCNVFSSDQRVACPPQRKYVYPDISVVCGTLRSPPEAADVLLNPAIVVEVLSRSTEEYDRGLKWQGYQTLESLTDYVLVSQSAMLIEHFQRNSDGSWTYRSAGRGERIVLASGAELSVDVLYAGSFEIPGDDAAAS